MSDAFDRLKMKLVNDLKQVLSGGSSVYIHETGRLIYAWFTDLSATRSWHANGPNPISYQEIEAYRYVSGWPIRPHEVQAIRELDQAYIEHFYIQQKSGPANLQTLPRSSGSAINPDVFDAVFG